MPKTNKKIRLLSVRRLLVSVVLGFVLPLSYAFVLSLIADYGGRPIPEVAVYFFGWPRPLWIFLMGRQPTESDLVPGLIFVAICNIVLYGTLVYFGLLALQFIRHKPTDPGLPPSPT